MNFEDGVSDAGPCSRHQAWGRAGQVSLTKLAAALSCISRNEQTHIELTYTVSALSSITIHTQS